MKLVEEPELDKLEKRNPQESTSDSSPITGPEGNAEDPYTKMIIELSKGNYKITYKDF